jgi:hypothetical protein
MSWFAQYFGPATTLWNIMLYLFISFTHSWSWALLEKLPILQLFKNFPAFYGTRRFSTMFTNGPCLQTDQSNPYNPILSL